MEWSTGALKTIKEAVHYHLTIGKEPSRCPINRQLQDLLAEQAKTIPRQITGAFIESKLIPLLKSLQNVKTIYDKLKLDYTAYVKRLREIRGLEKIPKSNCRETMLRLNKPRR